MTHLYGKCHYSYFRLKVTVFAYNQYVSVILFVFNYFQRLNNQIEITFMSFRVDFSLKSKENTFTFRSIAFSEQL